MKNQGKVAFYTLGCKLNFSETSSIGRRFTEDGFEKVDFDQPADVYVINTCSVTENANKKCRNIIRRAKKQSPNARIAVIGCYAQLQPDEIASIPGVDLVLGANEKFNVLDFLESNEDNDGVEIHATAIDEVDFYVDAYSSGDRTRTFLKVQDGCDYGCTFCTIPLARGLSRSDTIENIVRQAEEIAASGSREVVLTGVNIGDFGKSSDGKQRTGTSFLDLVKALDKVEGISRYRISSIEPNLLTNEIIDFVANSDKFVPHFHIPLQSGSDKLLKLMRRRYLSKVYTDRVKYIKTVMPECCIGVDVIVGFPGETKEDFLETYQYLNELDISYLHVFTYSERPNTSAINMPGPVSKEDRHERSKMLRSLSVKKRRFYYEQHVGERREVLFESDDNDGVMHGFTDNYIKVKTDYDPLLINQEKTILLEQLDDDGLMIVSEPQLSLMNH